MKKQRQYRGSQGRRPEKAEVTYQTLKFAFILFTSSVGVPFAIILQLDKIIALSTQDKRSLA